MPSQERIFIAGSFTREIIVSYLFIRKDLFRNFRENTIQDCITVGNIITIVLKYIFIAII